MIFSVDVGRGGWHLPLEGGQICHASALGVISKNQSSIARINPGARSASLSGLAPAVQLVGRRANRYLKVSSGAHAAESYERSIASGSGPTTADHMPTAMTAFAKPTSGIYKLASLDVLPKLAVPGNCCMGRAAPSVLSGRHGGQLAGRDVHTAEKRNPSPSLTGTKRFNVPTAGVGCASLKLTRYGVARQRVGRRNVEAPRSSTAPERVRCVALHARPLISVFLFVTPARSAARSRSTRTTWITTTRWTCIGSAQCITATRTAASGCNEPVAIA